jgi:hypothetical protein
VAVTVEVKAALDAKRRGKMGGRRHFGLGAHDGHRRPNNT